MKKKLAYIILVLLLVTSFSPAAIAATITSKNVSFTLSGGSAISSVLISNYSDFSQSKTFSNNTTANWNICFGLPSCEPGDYTVYLRYLDTDGASVLDLTKNYTFKEPVLKKVAEPTNAAEILAIEPLPEIVPEPIVIPAPVPTPIVPAPKVSFLDKTQELLSSAETQKTLQNTATTFATTQLVTTPFLAFAPSLSGSSLLVLPLRIWNFILVLFGLRKRRKSWGIVYDSLSKQPLDPVVVTLTNEQGEEVATSITDMDGRYGFFVDEGNYKLSAGKGKYMFPSQILDGQNYDPIYDNLYYGETLELSSDSVITKNIPMDPIETDWNQQEKQRTRKGYTSEFTQFIARITNVLFFVGFATSAILLAINQTYLNILFVAFYIVLFFIRRAGFKPRVYGIIRIGENPIKNGVLRFWNELGIQVAKTITDDQGRYYTLISPGSYRMSVETLDNIGGLKPYASGIEVVSKNGIINKEFELPEL